MTNNIEKIYINDIPNKVLYVYNTIPKEEEKICEENIITLKEKNGNIKEIKGYHKLLVVDSYIVLKRNLGKIDNYVLDIELIDQLGNKIYSPKKELIPIKYVPNITKIEDKGTSLTYNISIEKCRIKVLYVYDNILPRKYNNCESVTYIVENFRGFKTQKNGYYNSKYNMYFISKNNFEVIKQFIIYVVIKDLKGNIIFNPSKNVIYSTEIESFLTKAGYSARANTTTIERHKALINALQYYPKSKIERYLKYLINRDENVKRNYWANEKRKSDIQWLDNYLLDSQRKVHLK